MAWLAAKNVYRAELRWKWMERYTDAMVWIRGTCRGRGRGGAAGRGRGRGAGEEGQGRGSREGQGRGRGEAGEEGQGRGRGGGATWWVNIYNSKVLQYSSLADHRAHKEPKYAWCGVRRQEGVSVCRSPAPPHREGTCACTAGGGPRWLARSSGQSKHTSHLDQ